MLVKFITELQSLVSSEILQSDNDTEFKGVYLELMRQYGNKVINGWPRTPRTQGLVKQANDIVKDRITAWKRMNESTHWANGTEVCKQLPFLLFSVNFPP